jgi:hypothetical protein
VTRRRSRSRFRGRMMLHPISALAGGLLLSVGPVLGPVALAHGPDPTVGGKLWAANQAVAYQWRVGQVPPDWMASAIDAAAADATGSRASKAASFSRAASGKSTIAYGEPTGCSPAGIACFSRANAPTSFSMWFRANGFAFDWGKLRWCQGPGGFTDGCFDAETIALDEFGHVEILDHHLNLGDESDYGDAVVQATSRARPQTGWNAHAFARCDVARLQLEYGLADASTPVSTCLSAGTTTGLAASSTFVTLGSTVAVSARLQVASSSTYRALSGAPLSRRVVNVQRRDPVTGAWSTVTQLTSSPGTDGLYTGSITPLATADWRAAFTASSAEGLTGSVSPTVRISISTCRSAAREIGAVLCP